MLYLEEFIESLDSLPGEIAHNLKGINRLDNQVEGVIVALEERIYDNFFVIKKQKTDTKTEIINSIREDYEKALKYSDEKINLAIQNLNLLERHTKRLELDLNKFTQELEAQTKGLASDLEKRSTLLDSRKNLSRPSGYEEEILKKIRLSYASCSLLETFRYRNKKQKAAKQIVTAPNSVAVTTEGNLGLEPTWCFCEGPSHNEMIGCDNDECIREWFHYACVGITEPPKGKWYCQECIATMERRDKNKKPDR